MFKKLLSNLPFNPSLINQVSFYAARLKRETAIRRMGFLLVALAMIVQVVAIMSPAQASLASSDNDIINGGFGSAGEAAANCQNNVQAYGTILNNYGISCDAVASAPTVTLRSTDYYGQLFSMGRIPYGKAGETPVSVAGTTYFVRYLTSWDGGGSSTYSALQVNGSAGTMFLLYDCGNLVFVGLPPAPAPPPAPRQPACIVSSGTWYAGWGFWYQAPNGDVNTPQAAATQTTTNPCVAAPPRTPACVVSSGTWYAGWGFWYQAPNGDVNTPQAAATATTTNPCVVVPPPKTPTPPVTPPKPPITPPQKCPYSTLLLLTDAKCIPCEKSQTREDKTACLEYSKKATNNTQNIGDANGTTAKAGDVITYTLSVKNSGKITVDKFVIQENLSDVLDYADVVNLSGGTKASNNIVSWPAVSIKPDQTASQTFTVKVKNPIPQTPVSSSDRGHFDMTMTNVYGNTINIKLPATVVKTAENTTTTLPNTGPGETLVFGFLITMVVGYFFARSRLMSEELAIVKADYAAGEI